MTRIRKSRSAVFDVVTAPDSAAWESAQDRVQANLSAAEALCKAWKFGRGSPGSDDMVREIGHWAHFLRCELQNPNCDPYRVADYAMTLQKWWRDLEANEALHRPLDGKRRSSSALQVARERSAAKRRKFTLREYRIAARKARTRKELAGLLGVALQTVRNFEKRQKISPS